MQIQISYQPRWTIQAHCLKDNFVIYYRWGHQSQFDLVILLILTQQYTEIQRQRKIEWVFPHKPDIK